MNWFDYMRDERMVKVTMKMLQNKAKKIANTLGIEEFEKTHFKVS